MPSGLQTFGTEWTYGLSTRGGLRWSPPTHLGIRLSYVEQRDTLPALVYGQWDVNVLLPVSLPLTAIPSDPPDGWGRDPNLSNFERPDVNRHMSIDNQETGGSDLVHLKNGQVDPNGPLM